MFNLFLIIFLELIFTYLNYRFKNKDLLEPSVITCVSLLLGTVFAFIGYSTYGSPISDYTLITIFFGLFTIIIASALSINEKTISRIKYGKKYVIEHNRLELLTVVSVILTIIYGIEAYRVGIQNGGSGLNAFAYMKNAYMDDGDNQKMNVVVRQGFKVVEAIGFLNVFLLARSIVFDRDKELRKYNIISALCAVVIVIFSGSRTEIGRLLFAAFLCYGVLLREKIEWKKNDVFASKKVKKIVIPVLIVGILILFFSKNIVKTNDVELSSTQSVITYLSFYFGSSVFVLNNKIILSTTSIEEWFFGSEIGKSFAGKHVYLNGLNYGGNTATLFESVISSGEIRLMIYLSLMYFLYGSVYRSVLINSFSNWRRDLCLMVFSMVYFAPLMAFYTNCFTMATNLSSIITIIIAVFAYNFVTRKQIRSDSL